VPINAQEVHEVLTDPVALRPYETSTNRRRASPEDFEAWEAGIHRVYKQMARIEITPHWAKILDFQTRLPSAVEELIEQARR
jgi:hypothetical protein